MPIYRYTAKDASGQLVTGKVTSKDQLQAEAEIRQKSLGLMSIVEDTAGSKPPPRRGVKPEDVILFTRQMATLVDAGVPILQTMDTLQEQATNPWFHYILGTVRDDIRLGSSLSASFSKHPKIFDNFFVNMIKVGEKGGVLTMILERVAGYMEKSARLKRKVTSAMIYPAVIVGMSGIITLVLLVKVVPTFSTIYASLNQELPAMTQALMSFSNSLKENLLMYVFAAGAICTAFFFIQRTDQGAYYIDSTKLNMPVFGDLICKVAVSRFCRTLSVLTQSGVPILESLDVVRKTIGNRVLERVVDDVVKSVGEGESIASPLSRSKAFPPLVTKMISVGEQSGQLHKMLVKVSDFFDEQVDAAVDGLTSLIEPIIIGFLGVLIGFIVMALFLPIINITQALN